LWERKQEGGRGEEKGIEQARDGPMGWGEARPKIFWEDDGPMGDSDQVTVGRWGVTAPAEATERWAAASRGLRRR